MHTLDKQASMALAASLVSAATVVILVCANSIQCTTLAVNSTKSVYDPELAALKRVYEPELAAVNNSLKTVYELVCKGNHDTAAYGGHVDCSDTHSPNVSLLQGSCLTFDHQYNDFVAGECPFLFINDNEYDKSDRFTLSGELNESDRRHFNADIMCKYKSRSGILCGQCVHNKSVSANSFLFQCLPSSECKWYNWALVLFANLTPVTIFFTIIIVFHISITSGYANAFILFAQVVTLPSHVVSLETSWSNALHGHLNQSAAIALSLVGFYSPWSLDVGHIIAPNICLKGCYGVGKGIILQYLTGFYCLILIIVLYVLIELHAHNVRPIVWVWKPFRLCFSRFQRHLDAKTSIIDAFATFLVLVSSKFVVTSVMILTPSKLYARNGSVVGVVMMYNGTVNYLSGWHLIAALFASLVLVLFGVLPPVLLLLYPFKCSQRCLTRLKLNRPGLIIFMDAFNGCFKDGTDGTRDLRAFSSLYFIVRLVAFIIYSTVVSHFHYPLLQLLVLIMCSSVVLLLAILRPYKKDAYNNFDIAMFLYGGVMISLSIFNWTYYQSVPFESFYFVVLSIPFLISLGYVVYNICVLIRARKAFKKIFKKFCKQDRYYNYKTLTESEACLQPPSPLSGMMPDRMLTPERYVTECSHGAYCNKGMSCPQKTFYGSY